MEMCGRLQTALIQSSLRMRELFALTGVKRLHTFRSNRCILFRLAHVCLIKDISYFYNVYFVAEHNVNACTIRYNVNDDSPISDTTNDYRIMIILFLHIKSSRCIIVAPMSRKLNAWQIVNSSFICTNLVNITILVIFQLHILNTSYLIYFSLYIMVTTTYVALYDEYVMTLEAIVINPLCL